MKVLLLILAFAGGTAAVGPNPCLEDAKAKCLADSQCQAMQITAGGPAYYVGFCSNSIHNFPHRAAECWTRDGSTLTKHMGTCDGCAALHVPGGPSSCGPTPASNCTPSQQGVKRRSQAWEPTGIINTVDDTVNALRAHRAAYTDYSVTWAFWNSQWNSKCKDDNPPGSGLCYRTFKNGTSAVTVAAARKLGYNIVPIVEVCCACVLNASYDVKPGIAALADDLRTNGFAGYSLDMVCGGGDLAKHRGPFLDAFAAAMRQVRSDAVVSWWSHASYGPDLSFPNTADFVFDMDTYYYSADPFVQKWADWFQCQAGIGLEWPYAVSGKQMTEVTATMSNIPTIRAVGTWGLMPANSSDTERLSALHNGLVAFLSS
eukprot:TRINITY_DN16837_c0_g1_i1.p1 TRINITY_DN16837_c0_g1~~TRINITY_DN16837_c0_g1_i1.p1  ORF type:complete len:373 (-),score=48.35 TRINITY_DN16837_c0_g1_i1:445-1563(-)